MKVLLPTTLSWYFVRQYGLNFLILLAGLLSVVYIFDLVELLRRSSKFEEATLPLILIMGVYKLPEVGQLVFPFAILFSAMWTFWQLNKRHELVVIRSAGLSAWQFIFPVVLGGFIIGLLFVSVINPFSVMFFTKFEKLESQYLSRKSNDIFISEQGLWLRQNHDGGKIILHADRVETPQWSLRDVTVFFFSADNVFLQRIDADTSYLEGGAWNFKNSIANVPSLTPQLADNVKIETSLTIGDLKSSFSSPETVSFWKLKDYIKTMEETGFDSTPLKIHLQTLLAQPLLFMAMILLAASVSLRLQRLRGGSFLILSGVVIGFIVFFTSSFLQALGASGQIPIFVAAWFPSIISLLLGVGAMMVLEDG